MFLSSIKAEDRSPFGSFWFEPVGMRTASGARVTADSAMTLSAVFRAVGLVAGHMALLPVVAYKRGTRRRVNHPLLRLFNRRPNRWQNAFEWREMIQGHLELRGNAYNEIVADPRSGVITALLPRHPDRVKVEVLASGDYRYRVTQIDGTVKLVARDAMWHIRGLSSDGIVGLSVIEYARESFGLGLSAQSYGARFFANDAKPSGGWIEYPGSYKDKTQRQTIRETLQDAQSGMNRGKLMLLDHGMKYHEVGLSNEDAQFLETRKFQISDVARWFGVPPHKIGDLEKATFSNIEQMALEYVTDSLLPRAGRIEAGIEADLLFDDEDIDVEFDFEELLRGDSTARRNYYHMGILDGWLTRNEARAAENREPLPGLDEPLRPLNMVEESTAEDQEIDAETAEPKQQETAEPKDASASTRLHAIVQANAGRLARRIAKANGELPAPELLAESLGITHDTAVAWIAAHRGLPLNEIDMTAALASLGSTP